MNEEPDFQQPADDPQDPLLRALRERLGADFGQPPPPAAWAGIRRRLPAAPRPWWWRSQRLLPLLALLGGLLLVGGLAVRQAHRAGRPALLTARRSAPTSTAASAPATGAYQATHTPGRTGRLPSHGQPTARPHSQQAAAKPNTGADEVTPSTPAPKANQAALAAAARPAARGAVAGKLAASSANIGRPAAGERPLVAATARHQPGRSAAATSVAAGGPAASHQAASASQLAREQRPAAVPGGALVAAPPAVPAPRGPAALASKRRLAGRAAVAAEPGRQPLSQRQPPTRQKLALATAPPRLASRRATPVLATPPTLNRPDYLDSLTGRQPVIALTGIALAGSTLPGSLAARPDSGQHWPRLGRRWSVLVLAGPALSYRTQVAPWATATQRTLATTSPTNSAYSGTGSTSIFDQERPALGWGGQVQARRVLAGRWRLALGAGYQEYATRLNLQVKSSSLSSAGTVRPDTVIASVRQRDTYRVLTLPVQLEFALGPARRRLALGLLAGLEPSWYLGGRTTENTGCNCQQAFSGASGSPYNTLSLAFSLGLDARYQLGGPASRWQLVVQPTGRYIATRFVRSTGLGYALRQPYSLGLLTGLAWDF